MQKRILMMVFGAALATSAAAADGTTGYRLTPFAVPGSYANTTALTGINDRNDLVGTYADGASGVGVFHGFLYVDGRVMKLDVPGASFTQPMGVNNRRQVVGYFLNAAGLARGFLWDSGRFRAIDVPFAGATNTKANGINNLGQIVGSYAATSAIAGGTAPMGLRGFLLSDGVFTRVEVPSGIRVWPSGLQTGNAAANGINDYGATVGTYQDKPTLMNQSVDLQYPWLGFTMDGDQYTPVQATSTSPTTRGLYQFSTTLAGINIIGQMVGHRHFYRSPIVECFLLDHGVETLIPTAVIVTGINAKGVIVGATAAFAFYATKSR